MLGRLFIAFLVGLVVAGGIAWYLHPRPEPPVQVAAATQQVPAPAPSDVAEPAPAPPPVEPAAPKIAAPPPVKHTEPVEAVTSSAPKKEEAPPAEQQPASTPIVIPAPQPAEPPVYSPPLPVQNMEAHPPQGPPDPPKPAEPAVPKTPRTVTIPAGTLLTVRLNETLDSGRNEKDYTFRATLDAPLIINDLVIAERGSTQLGRIVDVGKAGRASNGHLALALTRLATSDGQTVDIETEVFSKTAEHSTDGKHTAKNAGVGAMVGAAIGAMAGGGKGAAIGAGAGAGIGAGSVALQRKTDAVLPSETRISFRLKSAVTLTEKLPN